MAATAKSQRKFEIFLDPKYPITKRFKNFLEYIGKEAKRTFEQYANDIYQGVLGVSNLQAAKGRFQPRVPGSQKDLQEKDVLNMLKVVSKMLVFLPALVKQDYKISLLSVLRKLLVLENIHMIRLESYSLALHLLDISEPEDEAPLLELINNTVDYSIFAGDFKNKYTIRFRNTVLKTEQTATPLMPSKEPFSKTNALELLSRLVTWVDAKFKSGDRAAYWAGIFQQVLYVHCYPAHCQEAGILKSFEETGFREHCPNEVQELLMPFLRDWLQVPALRELLFHTPPNRLLLLGQYRQFCALPLTYLPTITLALATFRDLLFVTRHEKLEAAELARAREFYFAQFPHIFEATHKYELSKEHVEIFRVIVATFTQLITLKETLGPRVRNSLLINMVDVADRILGTFRTPLAEEVVHQIMDTLLMGWIFVQEQDAGLWGQLKYRLQVLSGTAFGDLVLAELGVKSVVSVVLVLSDAEVTQLTVIVKNLLYPHAAPPPAIEGMTQKVQAPSVCPDSEEPAEERAKLGRAFLPIDWSVPSAMWVWKMLLEVLDNTNSLRNPELHARSLQTLSDVVDILLQAEAKTPSGYEEVKKPPIRLIAFFGRQLFGAAQLDNMYYAGKAIAIGILCRLLCAHHYLYSPPLMSNLFSLIHTTLTGHGVHEEVVFSVLRHTSNIFALGLAGATYLIPDYLYKIHLLVKTYEDYGSLPADLRRRLITIVCSLIFYPNHFALTVQMEHISMSPAEMRAEISSLLLFLLEREAEPQHRMLCVSGLTAVYLDELYAGRAAAAAQELGALLHAASEEKSGLVMRAGLEALATLAHVYPRMAPGHVTQIIDALCSKTLVYIPMVPHQAGIEPPPGVPSFEQLLALRYNTIQEWAKASVGEILMEEATRKKIMQIIDVALTFFKEADGVGALVREAAEQLLAWGLHFTRNMPSPFYRAADVISPRTQERDSDQPVRYYALGSDLLMSVQEVRLDGEAWVRVFLRDSIAKSVYQFRQLVGSEVAPLLAGLQDTGQADAISQQLLSLGLGPGENRPDAPPEASPREQLGYVSLGTLAQRRLCPACSADLTDEEPDLMFCVDCGAKITPGPAAPPAPVELPEELDGLLDELQRPGDKPARTEPPAPRPDRFAGRTRPQVPYRRSVAVGTPRPKKVDDRPAYSRAPGQVPIFSANQQPTDMLAHLNAYMGEQYGDSLAFDTVKIGIDDILHSPSHCRAFGEYLETLYCPESLEFVLAVDKFERSADDLGAESRQIWQTYFTPNAAKEVNVSKKRWQVVEQAMESPSRAMFAEARASVLGMLTNPQIFDKFLKSPYFTRVPELLLPTTARASDDAVLEAKKAEKLAFVLKILDSQANDEHRALAVPPELPAAPEFEKTMQEKQAASEKDVLHLCRSLLLDFGYFEPYLSRQSFRRLQANNERFVSSLEALDLLPTRETQKVAIIYVRANQESQEAILKNTAASPLFAEFVNGLGWSVDLDTHLGYNGALSPEINGKTSNYYADGLVEIMFHDITQMPTVENDPQQIMKKKHVGNDHVHIVWSEHWRDYDVSTIKSQFNHAHIVIYPLPSGLFRIQIFRREALVPQFGPLQHSMTVTKQVLPLLCRLTALNALRAVRGNARPYHARKKAMEELIGKQKLPYSMKETLEEQFKAPSEKISLNNRSYVPVGQPKSPVDTRTKDY